MILRRCVPLMARLYGPAVRCKLDLVSGSDWSCPSVSGPLVEHALLLATRASNLIQRKALDGPSCHQILDATAKPFFHLLKIQLADLGGISSTKLLND